MGIPPYLPPEKSVCRSAAAAAAKLPKSCPTPCDPIDSSPLGSPIPGILQARTLEWVAISFSNAWKWKVKVKSLSCVRLLATPWTAAYQAPLSMGSSRQEYWSGVTLPSPYIGLEGTIRTRNGIMDWFQIGKGVCQGCILSPCLFNFCSEYIMWNAQVDESKAGIKIARRNINNLRYAEDATLMAESEEELKSLLMKVKEESGLKLNIKKWRSWHPVPSLHGRQKGGKWKQWQILFSWAPKSLQMMIAAMKLKDVCSLEGVLWQT